MSKKVSITDMIPDAMHNLRIPAVRGSLNSVIIAKSGSDNSEFVYKHNHPKMAVKNAIVAQMLNARGITAPKITVCTYGTHCFEKYPIISGKTLYEHINSGMPNNKIRTVYHELVKTLAKMSGINFHPLVNMQYTYTYQVARANVSDVNNQLMGTLYSGAVRLMNTGNISNRGLYHCGITPKNVIIDDDWHIAGLVDMDEVAISDQHYAFAMMAAKYQQMGFNISELMDLYEQTTARKLNRARINAMCNITNMGKHVMWQLSQKMTRTK